jgi:hypothetical protein
MRDPDPENMTNWVPFLLKFEKLKKNKNDFSSYGIRYRGKPSEALFNWVAVSVF